MPTVATIVDRTRRFLRDWPDLDTTTASLTSSTVTVSIADSTLYTVNKDIEVEQELMTVRALPSGVTLTVKRGAKGTTAASHATSQAVLISPDFSSLDILDALNAAVGAAFPYVYQRVTNTTLTTVASTYEYNVPSVGTGQSYAIPHIHRVEIKENGETKYRDKKDWRIIRAATPILQFRRTQPASATLRLHGYAPFPRLAFTDSLPLQWPENFEDALVTYAAGWLKQSGETGRVKIDTGAIDNREQANRVGSSGAIGTSLLQRFYRDLANCGFSPPYKHLRSVI